MIRKNRTGNDQLITLRSSEGERQAFVAGLDWVASPSPPGRIDVWRKARSIGASAYVPQGTLSGYCVSPEGRDLVGLPSLAAQLLGVLENSKDSALIVLKDQSRDTRAKDTLADDRPDTRDTPAGSEGKRADIPDKGVPDTSVSGKGDLSLESDSARFALIQIADGLILPTWDRILGQEDMLSLAQSLQEQVSRILMDAETLELLPDSIFGNDRIAAFEIDHLFAPGSGPSRAASLSQAEDSAFGAEGRLQKLPFDPGQSAKLAVIAACLIGGLLWFFEDSLRLFSDPVPEVVQTAPVVPKTEILSPASLLLACHAAFYKTWQAAEITPLGFEPTGVSCLAQPDDGSGLGGKSATGLVGPIIRYSWLLPSERNPALYRLLAEQSFRHWDYAVVTDRQAVSAFELPVKSISLEPSDIPSLVEFRTRLDRAFGLQASDLGLSRNGQTTLFVFRTTVDPGVLAQKALPEMEITSLNRDLRKSIPQWEVSGRLASIEGTQP